nr:hypothetical protein CFP56_06511 [Quercus suber]
MPWYTRPGDDQEGRMFHLIKDDKDAMFMTGLKPSKEPIVEEPQGDGAVTTDSNESSSDIEMERTTKLNPNQKYVGEDNNDSWDNDVVVTLPNQMGVGVMNLDYTSEELLSLTESSFNGNVTRRKKFPVFKPVSNPKHMRFEKNMLFVSPKQFKDAITECYKNPRCTDKFLARKLMEKVRRQLDIKLKDIQEAVHEKYVANISAGKANRAREKAQEFVDRKWDIIGIPCCDAIPCVFFNREAAKKYTNDCYKVSTYKTCYEPIINPINGQNMWTPTGLLPVQSPIERRPPGRPKKKRVREPNEPKRGHSKGLGIAKRCKSYKKIGHNKRSCKSEVGRNSSLPTTAGGGPNNRSSRLKQTINRAHAGGASGGVAINEPNPPRVPPTK